MRACRQLREQLGKSSGSDSEVAACKSRWQKESASLSAQWELASVGMLARLSEMSQRVGRGEILQTRLAAAAEVLRAAPLRTSSLPQPEPEPEPEPEPASPREPRLRAALEESERLRERMEESHGGLAQELEETRHAFHRLHEKYRRVKAELAESKREVRRLRHRKEERGGRGQRTLHVHYMVEGPPPDDDRDDGWEEVSPRREQGEDDEDEGDGEGGDGSPGRSGGESGGEDGGEENGRQDSHDAQGHDAGGDEPELHETEEEEDDEERTRKTRTPPRVKRAKGAAGTRRPEAGGVLDALLHEQPPAWTSSRFPTSPPLSPASEARLSRSRGIGGTRAVSYYETAYARQHEGRALHRGEYGVAAAY